MLLRDTGRYLFEHTVRNAEGCAALDRVVLATDATEVLAAAREVGVEALLTSASHRSGTDRVREALELLLESGAGPFDVVVNVQGDEPCLPVEDIERVVSAFSDPKVDIATLCAPIRSAAEADDPAVVKVVLGADGDALYFSRAAIPAARPGLASAPPRLRHIGVYAFRPSALREVTDLPPGRLEQLESLEQLRWLEAGHRIRVLEVARSTVGIDTPEDYALFVAQAPTAGPPPSDPLVHPEGE